MIIGLSSFILVGYYFLALASGKPFPGKNAPTRSGEPTLFWLQLTYPLYFMCLAANLQAGDTGATRTLQAVQHLFFALPVLGFGILAPLYAAEAQSKGEIKALNQVFPKGTKNFDRTVSWYQRHGVPSLFIGGGACLAFLVGFWAPLMVTLQ